MNQRLFYIYLSIYIYLRGISFLAVAMPFLSYVNLLVDGFDPGVALFASQEGSASDLLSISSPLKRVFNSLRLYFLPTGWILCTGIYKHMYVYLYESRIYQNIKWGLNCMGTRSMALSPMWILLISIACSLAGQLFLEVWDEQANSTHNS